MRRIPGLVITPVSQTMVLLDEDTQRAAGLVAQCASGQWIAALTRGVIVAGSWDELVRLVAALRRDDPPAPALEPKGDT